MFKMTAQATVFASTELGRIDSLNEELNYPDCNDSSETDFTTGNGLRKYRMETGATPVYVGIRELTNKPYDCDDNYGRAFLTNCTTVIDEIISVAQVPVTDTTDYTALVISHDGTGSPTSVNVVVTNQVGAVDSITITFVGGAHDGVECLTTVYDHAGKVAQCINSIGYGLSAVSSTDNIIGGDHPIIAGTGNLVAEPMTVEYNINSKFKWRAGFTIQFPTDEFLTQFDSYRHHVPTDTILPLSESGYGSDIWMTCWSGTYDYERCHYNDYPESMCLHNNGTRMMYAEAPVPSGTWCATPPDTGLIVTGGFIKVQEG